MEGRQVKLVREHHGHVISCNRQYKYIFGREGQGDEFLKTRTSFICCDSDIVSRHHAEIFSDYHGVWRIRDIGSRNGTFVNNKKLTTGHSKLLRNEDIIGFGRGGMDHSTNTDDIKNARFFVFKYLEEIGGNQLASVLHRMRTSVVKTGVQKPAHIGCRRRFLTNNNQNIFENK